MPEAAIQPMFRTDTPNASVLLYEGEIEVSWEDQAFHGPGSVVLEWQPYPRISATVDFEAAWDGPETPDVVDIHLTEVGGHSPMNVWSQTEALGVDGAHRTIIGTVTGELLVGNPAATNEVRFHVANFVDFQGAQIQDTDGHIWRGRVCSDTADFRVEIDDLRQPGLKDSLRKQGGFGLTHVGRATRLDGTAVEFDDVDGLTNGLHWWLSMLRSERTGPVLVAGIHEGETIWQLWRCPIIAPWRGRRSWLPDMVIEDHVVVPVSVGGMLAAICNALGDGVQSMFVTRPIDWYTRAVEDSHAGSVVVLAQAGLELMTWQCLVIELGMTEEGFGKLTAADALRLTLSHAAVDRSVPLELNYLHAAAQPNGVVLQVDGPGAITETRNSVVHPKAAPRFGGALEMHEAGQLAIRYLELLLLRTLGFSGPRFNRLSWAYEAPI